MIQELAIDAVRRAAERIPADSLTDARRDALAQLVANGLPTTADEDWKYTDLGRVIEVSNRWLAEDATLSPVSDETVASICDQFDAEWIVIRNGVIDAAAVAATSIPGLSLRLLSEHGTAGKTGLPLADFNLALLQDGLAIEVGAEYDAERPVAFLLIDHADKGAGVSQARINIEMAANSKASFIEYHASSGNAEHYANSVIDISLHDNAHASFVRIQSRDLNHCQTGRLEARLAESSQFHHAAYDVGGRLIRNDLDIRLNGREADATFHGLYLAHDRQHIDNHTRADHLVGPAKSQQEYRGILTDNARCVWNGKAIVRPGADGTDAQQANHNLLLSEGSEIDTKPELEIYADDVKCSHGTTVGQLDENAVFYLRTRGIAETTARRLIMRAFAQEIVRRCPIPSIEETISAIVEAWVARMIPEEVT